MNTQRVRAQVITASRLRPSMILVVAAAVSGFVALGLWSGPVRFSGAAAAGSPPPVAAPEVGHPAPALVVPALAGGQLSLAQYAGRPRVITFFAAWCVDCRPDLAAIEQVYRHYQWRGLVVLGIGVQATAGDVRWMAGQVGATFPIGYDETGDRTARAYQLYAVPTTVFVSPAGMITGILQGRVTDKVLAPYLARILPTATQ